MYPLARCRLCHPRDVHLGSQRVVACARGACTLFRGCRLYRPRGTTCQPLFQRVGPAPHSACLVSTDPAGCSCGIATRCRLYARGLYPFRRASSVATSRYARFRRRLIGKGPYLLLQCRMCPLRGTLVQGYQLALLAHGRPAPLPAGVVGTYPFRECCLHRPHGFLFQVTHLQSLEGVGLYPFLRASSVLIPWDARSAAA